MSTTGSSQRGTPPLLFAVPGAEKLTVPDLPLELLNVVDPTPALRGKRAAAIIRRLPL